MDAETNDEQRRPLLVPPPLADQHTADLDRDVFGGVAVDALVGLGVDADAEVALGLAGEFPFRQFALLQLADVRPGT